MVILKKYSSTAASWRMSCILRNKKLTLENSLHSNWIFTKDSVVK